jgi:hypothetical protein
MITVRLRETICWDMITETDMLCEPQHDEEM